MPIYSYRCTNCGIQFDQQQRFSDTPLTRCPECSKKALKKVYQPVGIVFKGSGFYATDHRSPSGASRAAKEEKASEAESKPESSAKDSGENKGTESDSSKD